MLWTIENLIMTVFNHLEMNQVSVLNNHLGVDMPSKK